MGGNFDPKTGHPKYLSETSSSGVVPMEKRVTATIILGKQSRKVESLSSLFEQYLVDTDRKETSPRIHNSIRVDNRKQELSISAGSGYDQFYAFSQSNEENNSIWIMLYLGRSRTIEFGREVLEGFKNYLGKVQNFQISDYSIVSSEEDLKAEKLSEKLVEDALAKRSYGMATFALNLICTIADNSR